MFRYVLIIYTIANILFFDANYLRAQVQDFELPPNYAFNQTTDYEKYLPDIKRCISWLETTPFTEDVEKRRAANSFLLEWLKGTPLVKVEIDETIVALTETSPNLLVVYLGGFTKHLLVNYPNADKAEAYLYAYESMLMAYEREQENNKGIAANKELNKLLKLQKKDKLAAWVNELPSVKRINKQLSTESEIYNSSVSNDALDAYNEGHDYTLAGDAKNAIKYYKMAISCDNNFIEAYDNLAVVYRRLGQMDSAAFYYKKSIELYPEGKMAHQNLGVVYHLQGKLEAALQEYLILEKLAPDHPEGYFGACRSYLVMKKFEEAIEHGEKARTIYIAQNDKWAVDATFLVGMAYFESGTKKKGRKYIEEAINGGIEINEQEMEYFGIKAKD